MGGTAMEGDDLTNGNPHLQSASHCLNPTLTLPPLTYQTNPQRTTGDDTGWDKVQGLDGRLDWNQIRLEEMRGEVRFRGCEVM